MPASSSRYYNKTGPPLYYCHDISNGPTTCCYEGQMCLENNLCYDAATKSTTRQYCSDPSWPKDRCLPICQGIFFFQNSSILWLTIHLVIDNEKAGTDLYACNEARTQFCCGSTGECCDDGTYIEVPREGIQIGVNTASPSATPTCSSSAGDASNEKSRLGIGLGVGLGIPLVGAIAAINFLWHRSMSQARSESNGGDDASSLDQMAKLTSPDSGDGSGNGYGQDADPATAATGTPGREAEVDNTTAIYQLEAERNTRLGLGDRCIYELP